MACILIVDDDRHVRQVLRVALQRLGHEVLEAPDGRVAIDLCRTTPLDLVITDLFMPEKDGLELLLELRALRPGIPVITMSGGAPTRSLGLLADTKLLGADRTVPKPFAVSDMLEVVRQVLGSRG